MEKRTDSKGRIIWGTGPDRTCLNTFIGFSLDLLTKEGTCPCCGRFNYASVLWEDNGVQIPPKEAFSIPEGEGLWAKLDREYKDKPTLSLSNFKVALHDFFKNKPDGK